MPLDMTGPSRNDARVHHRRYLTREGTIKAIAVQNFDYGDYSPERFVDFGAFATAEEAECTPLNPGDATRHAAESPEDDLAQLQAERLVRAISAHGGFPAGRI
ncbi:hypothetical protein [Streptomyces californicus]|uniref:hypothetical protein n=1 Tax=Streptomyces californicus TaxID=67351 RepID=UPI00296EF8E6|nr:hypothetical protein [Streptomyces californicus]MDW4912491.1 hypothetical protein [Streptomyces californicus]